MSNTPEVNATSWKDFRFFGLPIGLYAFFVAVILTAHFFDILPKNVVGGFAFMFVVGAFFSVKLVNVYLYLISILVAHPL